VRRSNILLTIFAVGVLGAIVFGSAMAYQINLDKVELAQETEQQFASQDKIILQEGKHYEVTLKEELRLDDEVSIAAHRVITLTETLGFDDGG